MSSRRSHHAPGPACRARSAWLLLPVVVLAACAPKPTALERYCDVVRQAEATFDPLSRPGALADPAVLQRTLAARVTTLQALAERAPDAVRTDAVLVRDKVTKVSNSLADKGFKAASADGDPVITEVLGDKAFTDASQRLAEFNRTGCTA